MNVQSDIQTVFNLAWKAYIPAYLAKRCPHLYVPLIAATATVRILYLFVHIPFATYRGLTGTTLTERLLWTAQVMIYVCGNQFASSWYWAPETMFGIQTLHRLYCR